jgi:hypothetical protein
MASQQGPKSLSFRGLPLSKNRISSSHLGFRRCIEKVAAVLGRTPCAKVCTFTGTGDPPSQRVLLRIRQDLGAARNDFC